jgi:hypothetical protein
MSDTLHLRHETHIGVIDAESLESGIPLWPAAVQDLSSLQAGFNSSGLCLHLGHLVELGVNDVV